MMDTILNIGLSDASVRGLAGQSGSDRFAFDSYRRLIQMFGKTVLGIDGNHFEESLDAAKVVKGTGNDLDLDAEDLRGLVETFKELVVEHAGRAFSQEPREQLDMAVRAVFESWNSPRAVVYRRQERIPADLGTAVNVCSMVFGNLDDSSGTGVAFTRDPASGARGTYGDYLQNAQGEDVVAGIRNTVALPELEHIDSRSYQELLGIMDTLERHYRDLCDIEFTIERGKLWMLQTRVGKRTAAAAFRIATQLVDEGLIDMDEALRRVTGAQLAQLMFPRFERGDHKAVVVGMNASPGAAVGKAVFDSHTAMNWASSGEKVILVRRETNPDDLNGMIAAQGILTSRGGKTSHAAVVARGWARRASAASRRRCRHRGSPVHDSVRHGVKEGEVISIDGTTGEVFLVKSPSSTHPSCGTSKVTRPRPTTTWSRR
jgi:pyruvate,orthophosphate dikinase